MGCICMHADAYLCDPRLQTAPLAGVIPCSACGARSTLLWDRSAVPSYRIEHLFEPWRDLVPDPALDRGCRTLRAFLPRKSPTMSKSGLIRRDQTMDSLRGSLSAAGDRFGMNLSDAPGELTFRIAYHAHAMGFYSSERGSSSVSSQE